jgi:hypothetical protein
MPITVQQGSVNTTNLVIPGLSVGIIPPQANQLNGVQSNIVGLVGNAAYGPINTPVTVSNYTEFLAAFGNSVNRNGGVGGGDLGAAVQVAIQNGANNIVCVRVIDYNTGSEGGTNGTTSATAASVEMGISGSNFAALLTARYSGSAGNSFTATVQASQYPSAVKVVLSSGLAAPETFDNISNASTTAFWAALVSAINNGNSAIRPRSAYFVATAGTNTSATVPTAGTTFTLSGGADGVTSLSSADYVGVDGTAGSRKGMYALRGTGCATATLVDISDMATWSAQLAFGLSERIYMITASPAGDTIAAATSRAANGAAGYGLKIMFGDWLYWFDTVNGIPQRLLSPATFMAARLANQLPNLTSINQQVYGVVGSQFANAGTVYTYADLAAISAAGYDVITPPGQGASGLPIWAGAIGRNTNYNTAANLDNYTLLTNYLVNTMVAAGGMGQFIGQPITPALLASQKAVLDTFYRNLQLAGLIGNSGGGQAYQNTVISTPQQQQNGITVLSSTVSYLAVNANLVVQLQAGQTVSFAPQATGLGL